MGNISGPKIENDFTYIVNGHRHGCPWFVADFLSPKVARLHSVDPTIGEMIVEIEDLSDQFEQFLGLGRGSGLVITDTNRAFFSSIACDLCNAELYFAIKGDFETNATFAAFWEQFPDSEFVDYIPDRSMEFTASPFFEIDSSILSKIQVSMLTRILSNR
jgi:hypothetical protein